jgi:nucleoside-diphosphate-sugar epimerase
MAMRVVVTGAAGFIGSHLSERLLADGHHVRGVDCFTDYYDRTLKEANLADARLQPAFELVERDLAIDDPAEALAGADAVFHLACQPGVRGSWGTGFDTYLRNNLQATQRLFEALRRRPVPVVFASSSSIYGDAARLPVQEDEPARPVSPYGMTKLAGEHLALLYRREHGVPVVSVRYFTVYGPRQRPDMAFGRFLRGARRGDRLQVLGDGEQSRDFTFVADAVAATVAALGGTPGTAYNIGGGAVTTINEVIALIGELVGATPVVDRRPRAAGDVAHTWADTGRARDELGWNPRVPLRDGLEAHLRWIAENEGALALAAER